MIYLLSNPQCLACGGYSVFLECMSEWIGSSCISSQGNFHRIFREAKRTWRSGWSQGDRSQVLPGLLCPPRLHCRWRGAERSTSFHKKGPKGYPPHIPRDETNAQLCRRVKRKKDPTCQEHCLCARPQALRNLMPPHPHPQQLAETSIPESQMRNTPKDQEPPSTWREAGACVPSQLYNNNQNTMKKTPGFHH